jgi:hypothetical protein
MKANNQSVDNKKNNSTAQSVCKLGFWTAIFVMLLAVAAIGIATTTAPARSGPYCQVMVKMGVLDSCITYPYTDVAEFVPAEYIWMYPASILSLLFIILVACIHYFADRKAFSQIALHFATLSAAMLFMNYFIQLAVMQPSLLKGELEGLSLFSQYNPHGIFIALEDTGYLTMGVAFLFIALSFEGHSRLKRAIKFVLGISSVLLICSLLVLASIYRSDLEYRYEVFSITACWITLIIAGPLISVFFKQTNTKGDTVG